MFDLASLLTVLLLASTSAATNTTAAPPRPNTVAHVTTTGRLALKSYTLTLVGSGGTNGDNDGYADTDETIDLAVTLINKTGMDLTGVTATLSTLDTTIECINPSQVVVASVAAGATFTAPPFRFKVGGITLVNRTSIDQTLQATFDVALQAAQFDSLERPIRFTLPLDLNATGATTASMFVEDFEGVGSNFGKFTLQTLDAGKNSLLTADGMRCQYSDPDNPLSPSFGNADCFPGFFGDPAAGVNDWHVHDGSSSNGNVGRAYTGVKSLHWGRHTSASAADDTTSLKQVDAVRSFTAINLPVTSAVPELSFAQQVSLVDSRALALIPAGESADRAVVEVNVLNSAGQDTVWKKIYPYLSEYDERGTDNLSDCTFDPTDDGNTEDNLFNPSDPSSLYGPSSTCNPEFVFACSGDTDYHFAADPGRLCRAGDGPGLAGSIDVGTWVRPRFNLQEFAGRRVRLRFLATSSDHGGATPTWISVVGSDVPVDDGWYIDDVRMNTVTTAYVLAADTRNTTALATCGGCTSITAALVATPSPTAGPGQLATLDAGGSTVDSCPGGNLQFQFWIDGTGNGVVGDAGDTMLRDFADPSTLIVGPESTTQYGVKARCSSATSCDTVDGSNAATTLVTVNCPSPPSGRYAFAQTIRVDKSNPLVTAEPDPAATVNWPVAANVDVVRGWLAGAVAPPATVTLRGSGGFTNTVAECLASNSPAIASIVSNDDPGESGAFYYLVRGQPSQTCAATPPGYTTNAPLERLGRDSGIDSDAVAAACP